MTDEGFPGPAPAGAAMRVLGQYVKDLSFENPGHPPIQSQPQIDLNIDVGAVSHPDGQGIFEVSLSLAARAVAESTVLFIVELNYAGLFQVQTQNDAQIEPMLLIEAPRLLFPFARRIIAEVTRDGGFPPLMIEPIDFVALYQAQLRKAREAQMASPNA